MKKVHIIRIVRTLIVLILLATALSALAIFHIAHTEKSSTYNDIDTIPTRRVAIVFGARVRTNRTLTPILQDRVNGAIQLYQQQKVEKILMSGDNSLVDYNEVEAMKNYAVAQGVPVTDIGLDHAGFSTYETCYRAKAIFSLDKAILVTQEYHMPRALYTCRKLGIDAIGYALPDFERYPSLKIRYSTREYAADLNMLLELYITHPKPKFLGSLESL